MFHFSARELVLCAIFAALCAVLSQISIPFASGVPFTLQTLIIQIIAIVLGLRLGTMSIILYLLLGAIGLPVFAQLSGGIGILVGPTGGFLLSFPLMAIIIGATIRKTQRPVLLVSATLIATFVNLLIGTLQFMLVAQVGFNEAMLACFWPFVGFGIVKALLAVWLGLKLRHHQGLAHLVPSR